MRSRSRRVGSWLIDRGVAALSGRRRPGALLTNAPVRITVLAFWGIGDAIHLTPMLRLLKENHPQAEIEIVGPRFLLDLFGTDPCVDRITVYAPPWTARSGKYRLWRAEYRTLVLWLRERRRVASDWIVTTRGDVREHLFASCMGGTRRFGYGRDAGAALLTDDFSVSPPFARGLHGVEAGVEVARRLGCSGEMEVPRLHLESAEIDAARREIADLGSRNGLPLLAVHAGASFAIRRWPAERFSSVLGRVRDRVGGVVLIADPDGCFESVRLPAGVPSRIFRGDLRRVLALLACSDVLLCTDSGIMHAGAALGSRIVTVFGPTHVAWFAPFGSEHRLVRDATITCGPCVDRCRVGTPHCMASVDAGRVARALAETLEEVGAGSARPRGSGRPPKTAVSAHP
jgi:ADP-heptose:LPS heptosyltransferase